MLTVGVRVTTPTGTGVITSMRAFGLHGEPGIVVQLDGWNGGCRVFQTSEVEELSEPIKEAKKRSRSDY